MPCRTPRPNPRSSRWTCRVAAAALGVLALTAGLTAGLGATASTAQAATGSAVAASGKPTPAGSPSPGRGGSDDGTLHSSANDDGSRPGTTPKGNVTFGLRPSGAKALDLRSTWTYQNLVPGQKVNDYLAVINLADQPTTFTIYAADAQNTTAGGYSVVPSNRSSLDLGTWIKVGRSQVTVPARSSVLMPFQLTVPRTVEPGDHAGGIVASFRTYAKNAQGNTVAIDSRVGSRVYARVKGTLHPRLRVEHLQPVFDAGPGLGRGSATVAFTVRNEGNVRLQGHQTVRIFDLLGGSVLADAVPDLPELLPGNSFTYNVRAQNLLPVSYFTAQVTVDPASVAGNLDPALAQAIAAAHFLGLSYRVVGLLLLILAALAWVGWRWWRAGHPRRAKGSGPGPGRGATPVTPPRVPAAAAPGRASGPGTLPLLGAGGLVLGLVAVLAPAVAAAPAQAAVTATADGSLGFLPAKGQDIDPMYAVLSAPCPAAATHTVGILTGKGFPAEGINVVPASPAGMRHDEAFGVPLQNSLKNFAAMNGVTFQGDYTLTVRCVDRLATKTFATFTGVISFSDPKHFTAKAPAAPPNYGVPMGVLVQTFPSLAAAPPPSEQAVPPASGAPSPVPAGQPAATAAAADPGSAPSGEQLAPAAAVASSSAAPATGGDSAGGGLALPGLLGGIALIGGVSLLVARRRSGPSGPAAAPPKANWPDQERV